MGMTIAEKILAAHGGRDEVKPGSSCGARWTPLSAYPPRRWPSWTSNGLFNPDRTFVVEDHQAPPPNIAAANNMKKLRENVKKYGIKNFFDYGRRAAYTRCSPRTA